MHVVTWVFLAHGSIQHKQYPWGSPGGHWSAQIEPLVLRLATWLWVQEGTQNFILYQKTLDFLKFNTKPEL